MIIALTGTPGTGKTSVARELHLITSCHLIALTELLEDKKISARFDRKRATWIVGAKNLRAAVRREIVKGKTNLVDGHLSYLLKSDLVVVLRCRPDVLKKRLLKKKWPAAKIAENVHAEIIDVVTIETLQAHKKNRIIEIDTTRRTPKSTALLINNILNNHHLQNRYRAGHIDWTARYSKYLCD
jgi:adenylate kinase